MSESNQSGELRLRERDPEGRVRRRRCDRLGLGHLGAAGIWHKEIPDYAPEWITRWHNVEADPGETECYAVLDSALTS
ncbi:MAG TPA: hypothetical protein VK735_05780 [Pseudonocardia sp.]|uniref:hypothetical protein n=1 Tax=Pseudonocardia sp. TaxID=60912 RepID=UPI002BD43BDD|nr:hypothetical protein [Pseudonocardia sp.]HTF46942.1 hypothetical protein [Pseudonocardia sp.]